MGKRPTDAGPEEPGASNNTRPRRRRTQTAPLTYDAGHVRLRPDQATEYLEEGCTETDEDSTQAEATQSLPPPEPAPVTTMPPADGRSPMERLLGVDDVAQQKGPRGDHVAPDGATGLTANDHTPFGFYLRKHDKRT